MVAKGVELVRAWDSLHNIFVSDGVITSRLAWQNAQFQLLAAFLAAGWTVESSAGNNNGGGFTSGVGNFIVVPTDIVGDSAGNNHSWARLSPPSGMFLGGSPEIVFDFDEPDAVTSSVSHVFVSPVPFTLAAGTDTARPTSSFERAHTGFQALNFIASTVANSASKAHYGWSDAGDVWIAITADGTGGSSRAFRGVFTPDVTKAPASGGPGSTQLAGSFVATQHNSGQFDAFSQGMQLLTAATLPAVGRGWSPANNMGAFVLGKSPSTGGVVPSPVNIWCEEGGPQSRAQGKLADVKAVPNPTPSNTVDQDDSDPTRYMCIRSNPAALGPQLWIPITNSEGALV